jgi:hypothetical protein
MAAFKASATKALLAGVNKVANSEGMSSILS